MFKEVKAKLTVLYTCSLVLLLFSFIGVLYFLISHEINQKESDQLNRYFSKEESDLIEDLYDKKHEKIEIDTYRTVFNYVFNNDGKLVFGEGIDEDFDNWLQKTISLGPKTIETRAEWKGRHFLLLKKPISSDGFVIIGTDITADTHLIQNITWTLFILTIVFSIIFSFIGYYFAGQAMRPISFAFQKQAKFVSDASHELRTPLSIFYSSVDLLMREEKDRLSPMGKEVLLDVKAEAHLMNKLVNDLLFLARGDKDQLPLEMKLVNLSSMLLFLCRRFSKSIPAELKLDIDILPGISLYCDETRIQQLVYILLDNALRYTKEGKILLQLRKHDNWIELMVEDTGCGITKEDLPFIFDRFYRADKNREKGGAGLGLSIAQSIVKAHKGKIDVKSTVGIGTTFSVTFKD